MKTLFSMGALLALGIAGGVLGEEPKAPETFIPEGSRIKGEMAFMKQRCFACHTLESHELPDSDLPARLKIHLGGDAQKLWTRDDYARAIFNPNHVVAAEYQAALRAIGDEKGAQESPMLDFNDTITVKELIDLATFLASQGD